MTTMRFTKQYCVKVELENGKELRVTPWFYSAEDAFKSYNPDSTFECDVYRIWLTTREATDIRPLDESEIKRSIEREKANQRLCVSCNNPSANEFCEFCLNEE